MKQISQHIYYLLLSCRKVSLPGLGTFSAFYEKAYFDSENSIFYPTRFRITFDLGITTEDSLLEKSIGRKLKIDETSSKKMIQEYVKSISQSLNRNRYCKLEGIGYLISHKGKTFLKDTFWKNHKYPSTTSIKVG